MPPNEDAAAVSLVIDGGGTKTECHLVRQRIGQFEMLGEGAAGSSNPAEIGIDASVSVIRQAIDQALRQASAAATSPQKAAIAIAGTLDPQLREQLEARLAEAGVAHRVRVFPDVLPIVLAAAEAGPALAVISGTGSVGVGRSAAGDYALVGGWGYLLGDEGSGYAMGRRALRLVLQHLETATPLPPALEAMLQSIDCQTASDVKRYVYRADRPRSNIAGIARVVLSFDATRDPIVQQLADEAAGELVTLVQRTAARIGAEWGHAPIAAMGGLFQQGSLMRTSFEQSLDRAGHPSGVRFVDHAVTAGYRLLDDDVFDGPIEIST